MSNQLSNYVSALRNPDFHHENSHFRAAFFPRGLIKICLLMQRYKRRGSNPWVGKIPWRRAWQPIPVFLPGESPWAEELSGLQSIGLQTQLKWLSIHTDTTLGQSHGKHRGDWRLLLREDLRKTWKPWPHAVFILHHLWVSDLGF